jgi:hypothetical protein
MSMTATCTPAFLAAGSRKFASLPADVRESWRSRADGMFVSDATGRRRFVIRPRKLLGERADKNAFSSKAVYEEFGRKFRAVPTW